jgi:hypothetical protein
MNIVLQDRVGTIAGKVWQFLNDNGESTIAQIKKAVLEDIQIPMADAVLSMSIGWLLREDNLILTESGKGKGYRLLIKLKK